MKSKGIRFFSLALCLLLVSCAPSAPVFERNENQLKSSAENKEPSALDQTDVKQTSGIDLTEPSKTDGETTRTGKDVPDPLLPDYHNVLGNTTLNVRLLYSSMAKLIPYGDSLYFCADGTIKKYNVKTGICSSACTDPGCTHKSGECPLAGVGTEKIDHIKDDVIYWAERGGMFEETEFYAYDMKTFQKTLLLTLTTISGTGIKHADYGDYLYFKYPVLRENGDPKKTEDYQMSILEINKKTGEQKTAFFMEHGSDMLITCLDDGRLMFSYSGGGYYLIDRDGRNMHIVEVESIPGIIYLNGTKLYYSRMTGTLESIYPGGAKVVELTYSTAPNQISVSRETIPFSGGCSTFAIYSLDLETGKEEAIVSETTGPCWYMTDQYIYYCGFDYRMLEGEYACGPSVKWGEEKAPAALWMTGELFRVDLNGSNKTLVCDNFFLHGLNEGIVVGDYLLQECEFVYDKKTDTFNYDEYFFRKIARCDLTSGECRVIEGLKR